MDYSIGFTPAMASVSVTNQSGAYPPLHQSGHSHSHNHHDLATSLSVQVDKGFLYLVIVLGSSLSLVGLVFAFITYSLFSDLRSVSGTTMLNLLASLFLVQILYVIGSGGIQAADLCLALALSLLYARLSVVCWLLAATCDLFQIVKISSGLNSGSPAPALLSATYCQYYFIGWFTPLAPLGLAILSQLYETHHHGHSHDHGEDEVTFLRTYNCWFPSWNTFMGTFLAPCVILLAVIMYFLLRSFLILKWAVIVFVSREHHKLARRYRLQLFLFMRIALYLLLVVVAGGGAYLYDSQLGWVIFATSSALQGFVVALSVTCNCQVLKLYSRTLRSRQPGVNCSFRNEITKSSSLQLLTWDPSPGSV